MSLWEYLNFRNWFGFSKKLAMQNRHETRQIAFDNIRRENRDLKRVIDVGTKEYKALHQERQHLQEDLERTRKEQSELEKALQEERGKNTTAILLQEKTHKLEINKYQLEKKEAAETIVRLRQEKAQIEKRTRYETGQVLARYIAAQHADQPVPFVTLARIDSTYQVIGTSTKFDEQYSTRIGEIVDLTNNIETRQALDSGDRVRANLKDETFIEINPYRTQEGLTITLAAYLAPKKSKDKKFRRTTAAILRAGRTIVEKTRGYWNRTHGHQ